MNKAQDKVNDAAKENAEAAKAQAESNEAAARRSCLKTETVLMQKRKPAKCGFSFACILIWRNFR
jgi:hypothetical protein